jgi:antirestriction protein ArdC
MKEKKAMKPDVYQKVTDAIVAQLEQGVRPWFQPWNAEHAAGRITRPLRSSGVPYRGINVVMLWGAALEKGYSAPIWITFKQAHELGAHVRKREHGSLVVYANTITRTGTDEETGEETEQENPFMKGYTVFNVDQIDGLPAHFHTAGQTVLDPVQRIAHAESFFANTKAEIRYGGNRAYYSLSTDHVQMPPFETFRDAESYYATLAHETTHNAAIRIMPHGLRWRSVLPGIGHAAVRHNQSPSRNARSWSSGRKRPDGVGAAATRASAFSFIRMSAWM